MRLVPVPKANRGKYIYSLAQKLSIIPRAYNFSQSFDFSRSILFIREKSVIEKEISFDLSTEFV